MPPPKCPLCGNKHDLNSPHVWFDKDPDDFTMVDDLESGNFEEEEFDTKPTITHADPAVNKAARESKEAEKKTQNEYMKTWRERNREAYNEKQREYMRKRRQAAKVAAKPAPDPIKQEST